jgi:hypothetical protein
MRRSIFVCTLALVSAAWFAAAASARPWYNRYDYYYGPGTQPPASYYSPYSPGYTVVPPASSYYQPSSRGYTLVPPGSYYYSPAYPPAYPPAYFDGPGYVPAYQSYGSGWYWLNW